MTVLAEDISGVIETWLRDQVQEADSSRNAYLSEYEERRAEFDLPFDDPHNANAQKVKSHHNRLRTWASEYVEFDLARNDHATARLMFGSLMFLAGGHRRECLLRAGSAEEYRRLRAEAPTSVDLHAITREELRNERLLLADPELGLRSLIDRTLEVNEVNLVHSEAESNIPEAQASHPLGMTPVESTQYSQTLWVGLTVAQIIVAAGFRGGDYERVPFFQPRSITDQTELSYPLGKAA